MIPLLRSENLTTEEILIFMWFIFSWSIVWTATVFVRIWLVNSAFESQTFPHQSKWYRFDDIILAYSCSSYLFIEFAKCMLGIHSIWLYGQAILAKGLSFHNWSITFVMTLTSHWFRDCSVRECFSACTITVTKFAWLVNYSSSMGLVSLPETI